MVAAFAISRSLVRSRSVTVGPFGVGDLIGGDVDLSRRDGGASVVPAAVGTPRRLPVAVLDLAVVRAWRRLLGLSFGLALACVAGAGGSWCGHGQFSLGSVV